MADVKSSGPNWSEQIGMLRALTERTGVIHEAQVVNIRLAPWSIDPALDRHEAKVDLDNKVVKYEWTSVGRSITWQPDTRYAERLKALDNHVRFLLGGGWQTTVSMNGIRIFPLVGKPTRRGKLKGKSRRKSGRSSKRRR